MDKALYWSFHTGEIYEVFPDEEENLDNFQVKLVNKPSKNCRKCHGRFYIGKNVNTELYVPCSRCSKKCVDFSNLKSNDNAIQL